MLCLWLAVLELTMYTRLASNLQRSACLCLPSAGIKSICYHTPHKVFLKLRMLTVLVRVTIAVMKHRAQRTWGGRVSSTYASTS